MMDDCVHINAAVCVLLKAVCGVAAPKDCTRYKKKKTIGGSKRY